jgi:hypothetical protein
LCCCWLDKRQALWLMLCICSQWDRRQPPTSLKHNTTLMDRTATHHSDRTSLQHTRLVQMSLDRTPSRLDKGLGLRYSLGNRTVLDMKWKPHSRSRIRLNKSLEQRLQ